MSNVNSDSEQDSMEFDPAAFRRLMKSILRYRGHLISGFSLILVATFASLLQPYLFGFAIGEAIRPKDWDLLRRFVVIFFGIEVVRWSATTTNNYIFALLGQKVMQDLRLSLLGHLQKLPLSLYDRTPVGRLVTRVTNDISSLAEMFSSGFASIFANILFVFGIVCWLFVLDARLAAISLIPFPFLIWASVYLSGKLKIAYREMRSRLSSINSFLAENILGMKVVHLFNRQKIHLDRFYRISARYTEAQTASVKAFAFLQPAITLCTGATMALVISFGAVEAYEGKLKLGVLIAFYTYVLALFQPIREIADKWNIFLSGMASSDRIFSILAWAPESGLQETEPEAVKPLQFRGDIRFENVWFAYDGGEGEEHWILKDFSLEIKAGSKVGIVGHTGAGKTTLISLLMRFYEPQKGRILLDGIDVRTLDKRALRAAFGMVQQDVFLFSGSIHDNVTLWRMRSVKLPKPIEAFGDWMGSDRELDERGSNLSAGERQLVAFARTCAQKPSIWILDEASANVDSETEAELGEALAIESAGKTVFTIAHRLATIRGCDVILVMHQGACVERGSHEELLSKDGLYSRLYRYHSALATTGPMTEASPV